MSREKEQAEAAFEKAMRAAFPSLTDEQFYALAEAMDSVIDARVSDALDREHNRGDYRYD